MFNLGLLYHNGFGVPQDFARAREFYEKAAAKDDAVAMASLGSLYQNGFGVPQDFGKAREFYEKAAAKDNAVAMVNLGFLYQNGFGVPQDFAKAREFYEKAAAKDDAVAMVSLGLLYQNGFGVPQDFAKASELYERAVSKDDAQSMVNLGALYENGLGVMQDFPKAREFYELAIAKGNASARIHLEKLSIREAEWAGRYAEALQLQEAFAAKVETDETKREGRAGKETRNALINMAWYALLARNFTKALTIADRAHALFPDDFMVEPNKAHALMFIERGDEAKALYFAHRGQLMSEADNRTWERVITDDFAELRKSGLTHPMMADVEKEFGSSPWR